MNFKETARTMKIIFFFIIISGLSSFVCYASGQALPDSTSDGQRMYGPWAMQLDAGFSLYNKNASLQNGLMLDLGVRRFFFHRQLSIDANLTQNILQIADVNNSTNLMHFTMGASFYFMSNDHRTDSFMAITPRSSPSIRPYPFISVGAGVYRRGGFEGDSGIPASTVIRPGMYIGAGLGIMKNSWLAMQVEPRYHFAPPGSEKRLQYLNLSVGMILFFSSN